MYTIYSIYVPRYFQIISTIAVSKRVVHTITHPGRGSVVPTKERAPEEPKGVQNGVEGPQSPVEGPTRRAYVGCEACNNIVEYLCTRTSYCYCCIQSLSGTLATRSVASGDYDVIPQGYPIRC